MSLRQTELASCFARVQGLEVDACVLAGDLNTHAGERLPCRSWADAFEAAGSPAEHEGTWEPLEPTSAARASKVWRFDRMLWLRKCTQQDEDDAVE